MKSAKDIVYHLFVNLPNNKIIEKKFCFMHLKTFLPKSFQDHILFIYDKGNTLFFVFDNHIVASEFNYKIIEIKAILKNFKEKFEACRHITQIKSFVSYKTMVNNNPSSSETFYKEPSNGDFKNSATDSDVKKIFEEIREIIKRAKNF